jgi:hypothetical protein
MASLPDPLTPPDLDLRDFEWMPLEVVRLRDSGIVVVASAEAFRAAVLLWCASWHQVPASSLPKDERMLCSLAGFGRDLKSWRAVATDALHGFIECGDGRLYHPVIAKNAIESGSKKKRQGSQTAAATEARRLAKIQRDEAAAEEERQRNVSRNDDVTSDVASQAMERNGYQGRGEERIGEEKTGTEKKGERGSPPDLGDARLKNSEPTPMTLDFMLCESDMAMSASIGMADAAIKSELTKFIARNMQDGAKRVDWSAAWVLWCQRWKERPGSLPKSRASTSSQFCPTDAQWDAAVKLFALSESKWSGQLGPEPGMTSCRCPPEILRRNGIDPATGMKLREPV